MEGQGGCAGWCDASVKETVQSIPCVKCQNQCGNSHKNGSFHIGYRAVVFLTSASKFDIRLFQQHAP